MLHIIGDIHGDASRLKNIPNLSKGDTVLVVGDFGLVWSSNSPKEEYQLDLLEKLHKEQNITYLFCDGNHENFVKLYTYPTVYYNGAKAHKIREGVFHLMRGEIMLYNGKKFFIFGGATSIDQLYRTPYLSWWKEENFTPSEKANALNNLSKVGYAVDCVITHTAPKKFVEKLPLETLDFPCRTQDFLTQLEPELTYDLWLFGHFHIGMDGRDDKFIALYYDSYEYETEVFHLKTV